MSPIDIAIERNPDWADRFPYTVVCPVCRKNHVHFTAPTYIEGNDNYESGIGVRGDVIALNFWSECGSVFKVYYGFHKGQTFISTDVVTSCRIDYHTYIQSDEWKEKASAAKERAGYRCQICNESSLNTILDAHHRTYERLGNEKLDDITVLCRDCHELYEKNKKARRNGGNR